MQKYSPTEAKEWVKENVKGIYVTMCTPEIWNETDKKFELDENGIRHDVNHYLDVCKVSGFFLLGLYGNFYSFSLAERKRFAEIVVDEVKGRVPVVCNCEHETYSATIELIKHAESIDVDMVSLTGPRFAGNSQSVNSIAVEYFSSITAQTKKGVVIDNINYVGYLMSPQLMSELGKISNVGLLKNVAPVADTIQLRNLVNSSIDIIDPTEENLMINMLQFGQKAVMNGTSMMYDSAISTPMKNYFDAALMGDQKKAVELYYNMQPLRNVYEKWINTPWNHNNRFPLATVKFWVQQLGLSGGTTRPPELPLTNNQKMEIIADLQSVGKIKQL